MPLFKTRQNPKVSAIIVAAGSSSRMEGIDKQLVRIGGIPTVVHTLEAFENCEMVSEIILVCREDNIPELNRIVNFYKIAKVKTIVKGGETRQKSVLAGIKETMADTLFYCIHDGARPLVSQNIICQTILDAVEYGCAAAAVKVKDTIKIGKDGFIENTPNRETLYMMQTPQVFGKEIYKKAIEKALEDNKDYTDDCQMVEALGEKIYLSLGEYTNIKITTPEDIAIAEALIDTLEE